MSSSLINYYYEYVFEGKLDMSKTMVSAVYENGVIKPLEKVELSNHEKIQLIILPVKDKVMDLAKIQKRALKKYRGIGKSGLNDVARNHDAYLY